MREAIDAYRESEHFTTSVASLGLDVPNGIMTGNERAGMRVGSMPPKTAGQPFLYRVPSSWGFVALRNPWLCFRGWYDELRTSGRPASVEHQGWRLRPFVTMAARPRGNIWTALFMLWMNDFNLFTLYPNLQWGQSADLPVNGAGGRQASRQAEPHRVMNVSCFENATRRCHVDVRGQRAKLRVTLMSNMRESGVNWQDPKAGPTSPALDEDMEALHRFPPLHSMKAYDWSGLPAALPFTLGTSDPNQASDGQQKEEDGDGVRRWQALSASSPLAGLGGAPHSLSNASCARAARLIRGRLHAELNVSEYWRWGWFDRAVRGLDF